MPARPSRPSRRLRRLRRRVLRSVALALLTSFALMLTTEQAMAQGATLPPLSVALAPLRDLYARVTGDDPAWSGVPSQRSGTAHQHDGFVHDTRAGGGTGRAPGKGRGELNEATPAGRKFTTGSSAKQGQHGYDPATSKRLAGRSTANSDFYQNTDGTFSRSVTQGVTNYRDAKGDWQPIDTTVVKDPDGRWRQSANSLSVEFAAKASDGALATLGTDAGHQLSYGLKGAAPVQGTATGSTVTYQGALPDTDLQLAPMPTGIKESVVLRSADAGNSWTFPLDLRGLTPELNTAGGVDLKDAAGKTVQSIPAGYAFDAKTDPVSGEHPSTHAVRYELVTDGGKPALRTTLDAAWLHDPARVFPVTVDPSIWDRPNSTYVETGADIPQADHSMEPTIKVGSYDSGTHSANSFVQDWYDAFDGSGVSLVSAHLWLYDIWASTCTPQSLSVAQVTTAWSPSTTVSYPGPSRGAQIGTVTPTVNNACKNTGGSYTGGDWVIVTLDNAAVQNWANGTTADYGLAVYAPTNDNLHWKQFGSMANPGIEPKIVYDYTGNVPPQVDATFPESGNAVDTLTPELQAFGDDDTTTSLQYRFYLYDTAGTLVVDSGLTGSGNWTVPAGKLTWGTSYYWTVQAYDGSVYSGAAPWSSLSVQVPQPALTSSLSQNGDARGFNPAIGNFTKSVTDADLTGAGPALEVSRDYNSRDYRTTGAFGAGWSSVLDSRATERYDATGAMTGVVVSYPDGSQVGFGKNADGSFSPPSGRFATLRKVAGGYTLTDKNASVYSFGQDLGSGGYGISSVTDANGRAITFTWTSGKISTMSSGVSGRQLRLTWATPSGAGSAHVATVVTDPVTGTDQSTALTWTYNYAGDRLASVCQPTDAVHCSQYGYTNGSQFQTQVLDAGASNLWPLSESTPGSGAASAVLSNENADRATYTNVTLGQPGPLTASTATAAGFNGSNSYVEIPRSLAGSSSQYTVSMWFRTTAVNGVLFSYSVLPIDKGTSLAQYTPSLYVDSNGRLAGEFWYTGGPAPMVSPSAVNDGNWHQVVLAGAGSSQKLYLDGTQIGSATGMISRSSGYTSALQTHTYVGAGFLGGKWPNQPHYSTSDNTGYASYFNGTIGQVATFTRGLTAAQVAQQYQAGKQTGSLLTGITRPSGKQFAGIQYDTNAALVTQVTDENGGVWKLGRPQITGSSKVYRSAVLGSAPAGYWRLGDTAGASTALDEVNYGRAAYNNVTLGADGPFTDAKAAKFDGSSSFVRLPATTTVGTADNSVEMWFNVPAGNTAGGVLFDYAGAALNGGAPRGSSWVPALYVGTDGKLHSKFWDQYATAWQVVTPKTVNDGNWHHVVLAANSGKQTLYVDGVMIGNTTGTRTTSASSYVYIGAGESYNWPNAPGNELGYFPGSIAEVAFYKSELSAAEVTAHFQAARNSTGLLPLQTVQVVEPTGKTLSHEYDVTNGYRAVADVDGEGNRTSYGYDTGGFMRTVTDPNGNVTTTGHDVRGNTVSVTACQNQAAGLCSTRYFEYYPDATTAQLTTADPRNDVLLTSRDGRSASATDPTYLTGYGYDAKGNRTTVTTPVVAGFPNGRTTTTTYSDGTTAYPAADTGNVPAGLPVKVSSPGGAVSTIAYLHNGDIASTTMASGLKTTYTYDGLGRPTAKTIVSDTYPAGLTTRYEYDGMGQVVKETSPSTTDQVTGAVHTAVSTTVFDVDGNPTSQTVSDSTGGDAPRTRTTTYNAYDEIESRTDANGNAGYGNGATEWMEYDTSGNLVKQIDGDGTVHTFGYDSGGKLLTQTLVGWTGDPTNPSPARDLPLSVRHYDPAGRLDWISDAMGDITAYTYTDDGLTATVTRSDPTRANSYVLQSNQYDGAGNLVQRTSNNGATVEKYQVDAASRTTATTLDPTGVNRTTTVSFTPDDLVATVSETDSSGYDRTTATTYDTAGRARSRTVYGDSSGHPNAWWKLSQTSGTTVPDNSGTGYTAAASGVTWATDGGGVTSAQFAGTAGQQIATNGPVLNTTAAYTVSAWVNLSSLPNHNAAVVAQSGTKNSELFLGYHTNGTTGTWGVWNETNDTTSTGFVYVDAPTAASANTWTHLVGVYDPTNGSLKLYVNGTLAASGTNTTPWQATGQFTIGRALWLGNPTDYLPGQVRNVQAYQRALPPDEVSALYADGRTGGTVGSNSGATTWYDYDQRGLVTHLQDPNGESYDYEYDEAGNRTVDSAPTTSVERVGGNAVQASPTAVSGYNTFGEEAEELDPNGYVVKHTYDANGEETSTTDPTYTPPGSATPITVTTTQTYDAGGQVVKATRPDGKYSSFVFDQRGRLVRETTPDGRQTGYGYDDNGERLSVTDASGAVRQATYDWMGRQVTATTLERYPTARTLTSTTSYATTLGNPYGAFVSAQTSPDNRTTNYNHNRIGELTSTTDPAGNTTQYGYNFAGDLAKTIAPDGSRTETGYNVRSLPTYHREYDTAGTLQATTSTVYDPVGNPLSVTDAAGRTSTFTYDTNGRMVGEVQPATATTSITTSFGYDAAGHRTRFTDGRGNTWKYGYNSWGKRETATAPATSQYSSAADSTTTYGYDQLGQLTQVTQPGGVTQTMTYDDAGNLLTQAGAGADAATATRTFTYDALGQVKTAATSAAGTVGQTGYQQATSESFGYDDRGDLLTAGGSAGTSSFAYTNDGLLSSRTDAAGTTGYTYDNAGRLATVADPATGNTLTLGYNTLSQPTSITYGASGQTRTFGYDNRHRLKTDTLTKGASTLTSIGYGYDVNSNLTSKTTTGVAGAAANTYTYDWANRLTSWNNGTATTAYAYDASGNRIQVGSNVYTYDQRDQLTSDGQHTYQYSARGTLTKDTASGQSSTYATDAYGQQIVAGTQTYTLDASGRLITSTGVGARTFQYSGGGDTVASDGSYTYTWDAEGGLVAVNAVGGTATTARLVVTDQHDDVVGQFATGSTVLTGSRTYDPLGSQTAASGMIGSLGFQSSWTDSATSKVDMGSRWYNPGNGQFLNKDSVELNAAPTSVSANPFAYVNDNPLGGNDPDGHCSWYDVVCGTKKAASAVASTVSSAWNGASSWVSSASDWMEERAERAYHYVAQVAQEVVQTVQRAVTTVVHQVADVSRRVYRTARRVYRNAARTVRRVVKTAVHAVRTAYHAAAKATTHVAHTVGKAVVHAAKATGHAVAQGAKAAVKFAKENAASAVSGLVSGGVFLGCEAALGVFTAGVGAVAGAAGCGALAGAAGAAVDQTFKCQKGEPGACSLSAFGTAIAIGGIGGAVGGALGGAFGGKLASSAVGDLLPAFATNAIEGAAIGGATGAVTGAAGYGLTCGNDCSWSGAAGAGVNGAVDGAIGGALGGGGRKGCGGAPHSFTAATPVLMADRTTKPIGEIKVGDQITNAVPGKDGTETHTVTDVIVTTTDHDFVDLKIASVTGAADGASTAKEPVGALTKKETATAPKLATRALLGLAAGVAALGLAATAPAQPAQAAEQPAAVATSSELTTTYHHPFYDETQHAFIEAKDLVKGDLLQTPTGHAVVTDVRLYQANTTTYDLTIGGLHTYYVQAGRTPVLVHNNNLPVPPGVCPRPAVPSGKTAAHADDASFLSGWASKPKPDSAYTRVHPSEVLQLTDDMGAERTPAGFRDHGVDGQYFASHAERQAAVGRPNEPIEVDRDMCDDCIDWFKKLAQHRGVPQKVTDPSGINHFDVNGNWTQS
ncbi:LamG-like jellyroll fold domain-containing protein [Kitasatospora fiedleri]|uniref:LamG-like jellyroll fold domain-containing protein n=1 Tax=Kitasatospora fiedleri TaxID=2991545 RepID=UPI00249C762E|nr:LamG-like jellyroll fold domain-containing protein [Kitasatospora fiedleri]